MAMAMGRISSRRLQHQGVGFLNARHHGFDESAAIGTLDAIASLASVTVQSFINHMPPDWMTADQRAQLLDVWTGANCKLRVDAICWPWRSYRFTESG
jgi:hypothetical protein